MTKITFQCYACNQTLKVAADKAGKKAKCIKCQTILTIPMASDAPPSGAPPVVEGQPPAPPPPAAPPPPVNDLDFTADAPAPPPPPAGDDFEERPRRRRRRDDEDYDEDYHEPHRKRRRRQDEDEDVEYDDDHDERRSKKSREYGSWSKMRTAFFVSMIGVIVLGGAYVLENLGVFVLTIGSVVESRSSAFLTIPGIVSRIAIPIWIGGFITALVGFVFLLFGKTRQGLMAWAIATISVAGVALLWCLIFRLPPVFYSSASMNFGGRNIVVGYDSHVRLFADENYGPYAVLGINVNFGGRMRASYRKPVGVALLQIMMQLFVHATWMMAAFYLWSLGKVLKDRSMGRRAMVLIIMLGCSAGWQLIWPLLIRAFDPGKAMAVVAWLLYWIGVGLITFTIILLLVQCRKACHELSE